MVSGEKLGSINKKYFIAPFIIGVLPSLLCGIGFITIELFPGIADTAASVFMAYLVFIMLYAFPPALVAHFLFGYEVMYSPSGSMIAIPRTALSWALIIGFYIIAGMAMNRIFRIRPRN